MFEYGSPTDLSYNKKNVKYVHRTKYIQVRALFEKTKVRFARAAQLWNVLRCMVGFHQRVLEVSVLKLGYPTYVSLSFKQCYFS